MTRSPQTASDETGLGRRRTGEGYMHHLDLTTLTLVPLSNGGDALIDASDAECVNRHVWHLDTQGYPRANIKVNGRWKLVRLHRFLIGDAPEQIDHRDRDRLNNTRANLRPCTPRQNIANQTKIPGCTSRFKGVSWHRPSRKWMAQIKIDGHRIYLGCFEREEDAGRAYADAARAHHGEFAEVSL